MGMAEDGCGVVRRMCPSNYSKLSIGMATKVQPV